MPSSTLAPARPARCLVLQFPFLPQAALAMAILGALLVAAPPARPRQDPSWGIGRGPDEADEEPPEFGDGERDVEGAGGAPLFAAPTASVASARRARVTWRCQPCQLRTS